MSEVTWLFMTLGTACVLVGLQFPSLYRGMVVGGSD